MHRVSRLFLLPLVTFAATISAGCGGDGGGAQGGGGSAALASGTGEAVRVDMDAIFPAGEGRELVMNNCQSCHTWVPIVVLQMQEDEWYRWSLEHRGRVPGMSDEEYETLHRYLVTNFNPERPVPELPPALLESWTSY
jgi:mono/diheme cytochrome c family protein